ncbi:glycosyltransferase family 2 protein [Aliiroseovarius sp. YM-037]|uniref:glycosyltransferase family 2 protein n=1 Tax=Aliiroseovarius sp. YM-037 TaxID=3341728 RepID=UPI003A812C81
MQPEPMVAILLGLFNGARMIDQQLESFAAQYHQNWALIVSDDGSTDDSRRHVGEFAQKNPDRTVLSNTGPRRGFTQNFLHLLAISGETVPYVALSDQDDIWKPDKLRRAIQALQKVDGGTPALYASRTAICNRTLRVTGLSPLFSRTPSFRNALVQSIGGGNTMVLNRAALDLVQQAGQFAGGIVSHDWWIYQIVTGAGGHVIYDPEPSVLYRQHGRNVIGENGSISAKIARIRMLIGGRFRHWNRSNIAALRGAEALLTAESVQILDDFEEMHRASAARRLKLLKRAGLYRQTTSGQIALIFAAAFGGL